jgi:hypothetical protein
MLHDLLQLIIRTVSADTNLKRIALSGHVQQYIMTLFQPIFFVNPHCQTPQERRVIIASSAHGVLRVFRQSTLVGPCPPTKNELCPIFCMEIAIPAGDSLE